MNTQVRTALAADLSDSESATSGRTSPNGEAVRFEASGCLLRICSLTNWQSRLLATVFSTTLLLGTTSLAQDYGGYTLPTECTESSDLPAASKKVCDMLRQELPRFNQMANGYAQKTARRLDSTSGDIPVRTVRLNGQTFDKIAIRPEKDENDGHYPRSKAWEHYTGDSKTVLHVERFMECFEPRRVEAHPAYNTLCDQVNCPTPTTLNWPCHPEMNPLEPTFPQKRYVWEYYVPEYEIIIAKAGSHSVDPTMFGGDDDRPEFLRSRTAQQQLSEHDPQALADLKRIHGIPTEKWPGNPEWRKDEFLLQQGEESFDVTQPNQVYAKALQPNFVWRFADLRPESWWQGWRVNDLSAAWCWPRRDQEVFSNSSDQQLLWKTSNIVEYTKIISPEMWQATVDLPTNLHQVGTRTELPQGLEPSFRMAKYARPYADLKRLEIESGQKANQEKYIFYGGSIGPLTNTRFNAFTDPLRRDFFLAVTSAWQFGSKSPALRAYNTETRRQPLLTYYQNSDGKPGYQGDQYKQHPIRMIDKFNNIWPGKARSTSGAPGEPSKCARPNNVPNMEVDAEWPKDLATKLEYDGETRWIYWNKRVACACEICGFVKGCLTLNSGDLEEDSFEGTTPGTVVGNGGLPPPFEQARPHWLRLATATSQRGSNPGHAPDLAIPGVTDLGTPGPLKGILNQDPRLISQPPPTPVDQTPAAGPQQEPPQQGPQAPVQAVNLNGHVVGPNGAPGAAGLAKRSPSTGKARLSRTPARLSKPSARADSTNDSHRF